MCEYNHCSHILSLIMRQYILRLVIIMKPAVPQIELVIVTITDTTHIQPIAYRESTQVIIIVQ